MKVLGLGNALVDVLIQLDDDQIIHKLKFPKGSMQLINADEIPNITGLTKNLTSTMASGGSAANTIHGLSRLGTKCGYIGKVGKDELGDFYANDFKNVGVNPILYKSDTDTGRAYTLITPDSERTFATYLGAAVEMNADDLNEEIFSGYNLLHVEGYLVQNIALIDKALKIAKAKGIQISLDLASFNVVEANYEFLSKIIPEYVDILFANEDESKAFTHKAPIDSLSELANLVQIAVVKVGSDGSWIRSGEDIVKIDVTPVKSIDTTGAGDQYAAGFLHGYINKLSLEQCGKIGSLLAGKVIGNYGARISETLWDEVLSETEKIGKTF